MALTWLLLSNAVPPFSPSLYTLLWNVNDVAQLQWRHDHLLLRCTSNCQSRSHRARQNCHATLIETTKSHQVNQAEVIFPALLTQWRTFSRTSQYYYISVLIYLSWRRRRHKWLSVFDVNCRLSPNPLSLSLTVDNLSAASSPHLTTPLPQPLTTNKLTVSSGVSSAVGKYVTVFVSYTCIATFLLRPFKCVYPCSHKQSSSSGTLRRGNRRPRGRGPPKGQSPRGRRLPHGMSFYPRFDAAKQPPRLQWRYT